MITDARKKTNKRTITVKLLQQKMLKSERTVIGGVTEIKTVADFSFRKMLLDHWNSLVLIMSTVPGKSLEDLH
jgi:serine protease inhibitor ecotin